MKNVGGPTNNGSSPKSPKKYTESQIDEMRSELIVNDDLVEEGQPKTMSKILSSQRSISQRWEKGGNPLGQNNNNKSPPTKKNNNNMNTNNNKSPPPNASPSTKGSPNNNNNNSKNAASDSTIHSNINTKNMTNNNSNSNSNNNNNTNNGNSLRQVNNNISPIGQQRLRSFSDNPNPSPPLSTVEKMGAVGEIDVNSNEGEEEQDEDGKNKTGGWGVVFQRRNTIANADLNTVVAEKDSDRYIETISIVEYMY